jgi:hypothetical protein
MNRSFYPPILLFASSYRNHLEASSAINVFVTLPVASSNPDLASMYAQNPVVMIFPSWTTPGPL